MPLELAPCQHVNRTRVFGLCSAAAPARPPHLPRPPRPPPLLYLRQLNEGVEAPNSTSIIR